MILLLIFGIVVFIAGNFVYFSEKSDFAFPLGVTGSLSIVIAVLAMTESSKPSAIDVYKGKTTLEITYRDSVPVDSVVVVKNKEK